MSKVCSHSFLETCPATPHLTSIPIPLPPPPTPILSLQLLFTATPLPISHFTNPHHNEPRLPSPPFNFNSHNSRPIHDSRHRFDRLYRGPPLRPQFNSHNSHIPLTFILFNPKRCILRPPSSHRSQSDRDIPCLQDNLRLRKFTKSSHLRSIFNFFSPLISTHIPLPILEFHSIHDHPQATLIQKRLESKRCGWSKSLSV